MLLAAGVWAGHRWGAVSQPTVGVPADVVPAAVVAQAEEIHSYCSRLAEGLHSGGYPADVAALAPAVAAEWRLRPTRTGRRVSGRCLTATSSGRRP